MSPKTRHISGALASCGGLLLLIAIVVLVSIPAVSAGRIEYANTQYKVAVVHIAETEAGGESQDMSTTFQAYYCYRAYRSTVAPSWAVVIYAGGTRPVCWEVPGYRTTSVLFKGTVMNKDRFVPGPSWSFFTGLLNPLTHPCRDTKREDIPLRVVDDLFRVRC